MVFLVFMYSTDLRQYTLPVILGWVISFLNAVIGSVVIYRAFQSSGKGFFNIVLMSMIVRMFAIVITLFLLIYFLKIEKFSMAISMFFFYFLFLIFEINFLNRNREILAASNTADKDLK